MRVTRRDLIKDAAAATILSIAPISASASKPLQKAIPSSGERLPAIGLGSWITFNVGQDPVLLDECRDVIKAFFGQGGGMIDSSPMYGSSQAVIGACLRTLGQPAGLFSADKVWTSSTREAQAQIAETADRWGVAHFDLLQVHNLVEWEAHLETLFAMKAAGKLRYVGITTSHGRRHRELEEVMRSHPLDFVQLTYNLVDREAEARLLPLAYEKGIAVICNRPFQRGALPDQFEGKPLPPWASEIGAGTWPVFLLKFIVSHPAVTVAIPATRQVQHVLENKSAEHGALPDAAMRQKMADYARAL